MKQAESLMTFKEQLTAQADNFERSIEIDQEIRYIKSRMRECWASRAFTINLIVPSGSMAIGNASLNFHSLFVPKLVSPMHYRQLFVEELYKLGFTDDEIELYDIETAHAHTYSIKVVW